MPIPTESPLYSKNIYINKECPGSKVFVFYEAAQLHPDTPYLHNAMYPESTGNSIHINPKHFAQMCDGN